uniref:Uncharacterized protein n=1 Tax=Rhizophagus irregularis (strain DAOM 181602 / DAOM 197198 / MUCL 43194) TaxID=747089 RepID=U9URJ3_RHIID
MLELFSESDYCFSSYTWYQTVSTLTKNKYAPSESYAVKEKLASIVTCPLNDATRHSKSFALVWYSRRMRSTQRCIFTTTTMDYNLDTGVTFLVTIGISLVS